MHSVFALLTALQGGGYSHFTAGETVQRGHVSLPQICLVRGEARLQAVGLNPELLRLTAAVCCLSLVAG